MFSKSHAFLLIAVLCILATLPGCSDDELRTAAPVLSPGGGVFLASTYIFMSSATTGAIIRYTTNEENPTETTGMLYTEPVLCGAGTTFKARAFSSGLPASDTVTGSYNFVNIDMQDAVAPNDTSATATVLGTVDYTEASGPILMTFKGYIEMIRPDRDYFTFTAVDPIGGHYNYFNPASKKFHVRVKFLQNPEDAYGIRVISGRSGSSGASGVYPNTTPTPGEYTAVMRQFDWGLRPNSSQYGATTFTSTYIFEVVKHAPITGTNHMYEIEVSNGKYVGEFDLE